MISDVLKTILSKVYNNLGSAKSFPKRIEGGNGNGYVDHLADPDGSGYSC